MFIENRGTGITGSVLLIIFKSLISLCFITCLIRILLNLKNDQKNRPHDPLVHIHFVLFHLLQQLDEIIEVARVNIQVEQVAVAVEELVGRP